MKIAKLTRRRTTLISSNVPFTYHIAWSALGIHYYGCKYSWHCQPLDLWTTYFTSSKKVYETRQLHGEPDIIEVRKTFRHASWRDRVHACRTWESQVLRKLNAVHNPNWLNIGNSGAEFYVAGVIPAKDATTGNLIGSVSIFHPNILSREWVHHSTGVVQKRTSCSYCSKSHTVSNIKDHETHCVQNPNKQHRACLHCGKLFTDRRNHIRHQRYCTLNPNKALLPKYNCTHCNKLYFDAGKRNSHEKCCVQNPLKIAPLTYTCPHCSKVYQSTQHMKKCMLNPNRIVSHNHFCQYCNKSYNGKSVWLQHEKICHSNPNKILQICKCCNKEITGSSGNLVQHERSCIQKHNLKQG
jgi:hypothetical protein